MSARPATGAVVRVRRTFSQTDFDRFAALSGDNNPIHVDPQFAAATRFGRTVAHGMLLYSALWGLIRRRFPDARQLEQHLMFPAPTYAGEPMELELTVAGYPAADRCTLLTRVRRAAQPQVITLDGRTTLRLTGAPAP